MTAPTSEYDDLSGCRVLVVDDNRNNWRIIKAYLDAAGVGRMEYAADGAEGLDKLESFNPDLVILDLMMPVLDGHEFLRRIRVWPEFADLPVLVATAATSIAERNAVFGEGATDFVARPINGVELMARVAIHLRNRMLVRDLQAYRDRVRRELDVARDMQTALLPSASSITEAAGGAGAGLAAFFEPSVELGGDLWGMGRNENGLLSLWTVDFSGHGVSAALNTFRLHAILTDMDRSGLDDGALLTRLNRVLCGLLPRGQFATMTHLTLDAAAGRISFASAAAPALMLGGGSRSGIETLATGSLPLGIDPGKVYRTGFADFPPGSFAFLFSDALSEMPDWQGEVLEEEGVAKLLAEISTEPKSPDRAMNDLVDRFLGPRNQRRPIDDDLTMIWLESVTPAGQ